MVRHVIGRRGVVAGAGLALSSRAVRGERVNGIIIGEDGWLFASYDPLALVDPGKIRRLAALMGETAGILRRGGITLVASVAPARARTYRDKLPPDIRITPQVEGRYGLALREIRAAGLLVPDTALAFERRRRDAPDTPLFFRTDSHWTPEGAEAAAADMAATLAGLNLPPSAQPGSPLPPAHRTDHVADLAAQLPADRRRAFAPEVFNVRRPEVITSRLHAALAEAAPADVVVVGSSYMHPRYGYALRLSHELRRPVGLTWAVHQNGPWRTLLTQLGSEGFRAARPKVVVWNILELDIEAGPERTDLWRGHAMPPAAFVDEVRRAVEA